MSEPVKTVTDNNIVPIAPGAAWQHVSSGKVYRALGIANLSGSLDTLILPMLSAAATDRIALLSAPLRQWVRERDVAASYVICVTNMAATKADFIPQVVYQHAGGVWSCPLSACRDDNAQDVTTNTDAQRLAAVKAALVPQVVYQDDEHVWSRPLSEWLDKFKAMP